MSRINIILAAPFLVAATLVSSGCTNPHTPAGHEGYVFEDPRVFGEGGFRGAVDGPGNYGISAWRNRIVNVDTRPATYTEKFRILVKDDLNVEFSVHAVMKAKAGQVKSVPYVQKERTPWIRSFQEVCGCRHVLHHPDKGQSCVSWIQGQIASSCRRWVEWCSRASANHGLQQFAGSCPSHRPPVWPENSHGGRGRR